MTKVSSYRDLIVYQKSKQLTVDIITHFSGQRIPFSKQFLLGQLFRAVGSVPANIAEGFGRNSRKSFKQFVSIARGSSFEVNCWLDIIKSTGGFTSNQTDEFICKNEEISRMLSSLLKKLSD